MRITQLELQNIGAFEHQIIEFRPKPNPEKAEIHILTGSNGSGKSTILYALASMISPELLRPRFHENKGESQAKVTFSHTGVPSGEFVINDNSAQNPITGTSINIIHAYQNIALYNRHFERYSFDFAFFTYSGSRTLSSSALAGIQEIKTPPLAYALNFQNSVDSALLMQWIANTKAKAAFALQENQPERAQIYRNTLHQIEQAIERIVGYPVEFIFQYEPLQVRLKVKNQELDFNILPDGLKSIISWMTDLLMRLDRLKWVDDCPPLERNFILLLDEIEIHLHPAWQRKILPVVQDLFKNAQIFIATHSPFVVASVRDAWVYQLVVEDGKAHLNKVEASMGGSSYPLVLDEIFGIDDYFDVATEAALDEFANLKKQYLEQYRNGKLKSYARFVQLAKMLAEKSTELRDIIGRELRQIERITGKPIEL